MTDKRWGPPLHWIICGYKVLLLMPPWLVRLIMTWMVMMMNCPLISPIMMHLLTLPWRLLHGWMPHVRYYHDETRIEQGRILSVGLWCNLFKMDYDAFPGRILHVSWVWNISGIPVIYVTGKHKNNDLFWNWSGLPHFQLHPAWR